MEKKIISFDADGTIVKKTLVDKFWFEEVPKLYTKHNHMSFEEAANFLKSEYKRIGPEDIRWYLPDYWFDRFGLEEDPSEVLESIREELEFHQDALDVLSSLDSKYKLVVISNAPGEFLDITLRDIEDYFSEIYSCVSDLGRVKKDEEVYKKICGNLKVQPEEIIHVGDDINFDYKLPKRAGINSFLIDREENHPKSEGVLRDLRELLEILEQN